MKEVTEWDNNPREMWVWGSEPERKQKAFVIWIRRDDYHSRVITVDKEDHDAIYSFQHCAEIEKQCRRMTNKELSRWLREKPNREWKDTIFVHADLIYHEREEDTEVSNDIYVREGDSPWFVPFAEEE